MTLILLLLIFFLSWWLIWMMVLPFGVRSRFEGDALQQDTAEKTREGLVGDSGAPVNPHLLKKLIFTTVITAVFVGVLWLFVELGVILWIADSVMAGIAMLIGTSPL